jgi:gamma-glutamylcyclotransferase (GGCT)/AIG2-like uncharacterized protein YtfP
VTPRNINVISEPSKKSCHLFVYGTLLEPSQLARVLGHPHDGEVLRARLEGFRRVTTGYAYPYVVPDHMASVDGLLIMDLGREDLRRLDEYEDVADEVYRRVPVDVEVWGCGPRPARLQAETYAAGPGLLNR